MLLSGLRSPSHLALAQEILPELEALPAEEKCSAAVAVCLRSALQSGWRMMCT